MLEADEEGSSGSESEKSVHTQATRESLDPQGESAYDTAQRVSLAKRYRLPIRSLKTGICANIRAVAISKQYVPIQRLSQKEYELRMRVVTICGGSGHSLVFFDSEMGIILKTIDDESTYHLCLCMAISAPLRQQKLAPILCSGHYDGRMVLRDTQTGDVILPSLSQIRHNGPVTAVHVCEGERRTLAACGSQDKSGRFALYIYDFQRGEYACDPKYDHTVAVTSIATVTVKMAHSFIASASIDGAVHVYEMNGKMERKYSFIDNGGAVFSIDILPGSVVGRRPSLLLCGGLDGALRAYSLNTGEPFKGIDHAMKSWETSIGTAAAQGEEKLVDNGVITNTAYDGVLMAAHEGKINALAGINTVTFGCATGGEDGYVCIWNVETATLLLRVKNPLHQANTSPDMPLHSDQVTSLSVTLQPRLMIASGSMDQKLCLLDLSSSTIDSHRATVRALTTKARVQAPPAKSALADACESAKQGGGGGSGSGGYSLVSGDPSKATTELGQDTRRLRKTIFDKPFEGSEATQTIRKRSTMVNDKLDAYRLKSKNDRNKRRQKLEELREEGEEEEEEDEDEDWGDEFEEGAVFSPAQLLQRQAKAKRDSEMAQFEEGQQEGHVRISDLMGGGAKHSPSRRASGIGYGGAGVEYKSDDSSPEEGESRSSKGSSDDSAVSSEDEDTARDRKQRERQARRKEREERADRKERRERRPGEPTFKIKEKKQYRSNMPAYYAFSDKDEGKALAAKAKRVAQRDTIRGTINTGGRK